VSTISLLNLRD